MRVVALFRVSTEKQASEGASLDAQERAYRALAEKSGWITVGEFRGCESATLASSDRRVLQSVLACIRSEKPEGLYVHEQSRLTRGDELEVALLMRELRERKIKIIVNGTIRDLASVDERFMVGIQSLVDRAESERIKERMGRGKREKARQGKKASGPTPFGYRNPRVGEAGRGTPQVVPEQAVIIRRLFSLAVKGLGDRAIAVELNNAAMPAPRGGLWAKSSVRRSLANVAYLGTSAAGVWVARPGTRGFRLDLANPDATVVEKAHPPIIDRETWDAANGRAKRPTTKQPRMLTGFLYINGLAASGDSDHHTKFYRGVRGSRGLPWVEAQTADDAVWDGFVQHATSPEIVSKLMEQASSPAERAVTMQEIEYLAEQVAKARRRHERLVDMRAGDEITKAQFLAKSDEVNKSVRSMESELASLSAKSAVQDGTHAARVVKAVQALLAGRTRLTTEQKRAVLVSIVRRVDITAVATGNRQRKAQGGRYAAGRVNRWAIQGVGFELALPADAWGEDAAGANVGPAVANGAGAGGSETRDSRTGQLGLTPFPAHRVAGTESAKPPTLRPGQLATTY